MSATHSTAEVFVNDDRLPERFWSKVFPQENGCWLWGGSVFGKKNDRGYGGFRWNGRHMKVHRVSYLAFVGPLTEETVDHLCAMRLCVNPAHLEQVSMRENSNRCALPSRRPTCRNGHVRIAQNLERRASGKIECRVCRVENRQERRWITARISLPAPLQADFA